MSTYTPNLSISLRPSRALLFTFLFLYLLALACIGFIAVPTWVKAVLIIILLLSGSVTLHQFVYLKSKNSVVRIDASGSINKCIIKTADDIEYQTEIKSIAVLFNYFVVIAFCESAKDFSFKSKNRRLFKTIIAKDVISQEQLYALRLCDKSICH